MTYRHHQSRANATPDIDRDAIKTGYFRVTWHIVAMPFRHSVYVVGTDIPAYLFMILFSL